MKITILLSKRTVKKGEWFPLYYGQVIIGFAFTTEEATFMNAMLASAAWERAIDLRSDFSGGNDPHGLGAKWNSYIEANKDNLQLRQGNYISLRKEGFDHSLLMPFTKAHIDDDTARITHGSQTHSLTYLKDRDVVMYNDNELNPVLRKK